MDADKCLGKLLLHSVHKHSSLLSRIFKTDNVVIKLLVSKIVKIENEYKTTVEKCYHQKI